MNQRQKEADQKLRRKAFAGMTRPHLDALYRTAVRLLGRQDGAEDLVQEACLKAFRAFDRFEEGTNYRAWLFRIMKNTYIDHHVRRKDPATLDWDSLPDAALSQAESADGRHRSPEVLYLHRSFRRDALAALQTLPAEVRLTVTLILIEGFSYAEVAEIVDCPIGTVRSRLFRGRRYLQAALRDYVSKAEPDAAAEAGE